jgi:putative ABC transport system permease protein
MRSFVALREVHLGVQPDHVFTAVLGLPPERYKTAAQARAFLQPLLARVKALPGVAHAAAATSMPPYGGGQTTMEIAGHASDRPAQTLFQQVTEEYFDVLRLDLRQGRPLGEADVAGARKVAVVNETFVRRYVPDGRPLGRRVRLTELETAADPVPDAWFEVVGVVGDVTNRGLQAPAEPEIWIPSTTTGATAYALIVRTSLDPAALADAVRREVSATDPGVPTIRPGRLVDFLNEQLYAGSRFAFLLMTVFGCVGLILVTVGVYSVLEYSTAQKSHEIGIRMALGARSADALGMVVRSGLRPVAAGIAIGLAVSALLGRALGAQLVGVTAYDPRTLAAAAAVLMMAAAVACWVPARRAARVDPLVALRGE